MDYLDVLIETASEYLMYGSSLPYLSKTKLLKLTYIIEYYYYKQKRTRLTNIDWVYYLYGPYIFNYEEYIKRSPFSVVEIEEDSEYKIIVRDEEYFGKERTSDYEVKQVVKKIVAEYGRNSINEILDFVYFETEPMLNVEKRGDRLNFNHIQPVVPIRAQNLGEKEIHTIITEYKKRMENARAI